MPTESSGSLPHAQTRRAQTRQAPSERAAAGRDRAEQTPLAALWRTREYLRPYFWLLGLMLAAAMGAAAAEIAIPLLVKAVIDGPDAPGGARALIPPGLAATRPGVAQAGPGPYPRGGAGPGAG